jgi:tetratricopeptide (TPR) repeat protein
MDRRIFLIKSTGCLLIICSLLIGNFRVGLADIAPPEQPPGGNPAPGVETTQVRMVDESVVIDVIPTTPEGTLGQAKVTAKFTMQNMGKESETLTVRFPLTSAYGTYYGTKEIANFKVKVNEESVPTHKIDSDYSGDYAGPWAEFTVTFPPGEEVEIEVSYYVDGMGEYPYIALKYILETGAGWNGTIGSADVIVRFPYEVNPQNVIFDTEIGWSTTTPGGTVDGKEIRWHFEDFEPDVASNFSISLVMPSVWRAVLREKENVIKNPQDGEAWGRLGKLYKEIYFLRRGYREDAGGQELYQLSQEAYQKAVALLPEDALWKAGFADLLWVHWYYSQWFMENPDYTEVIQALKLLQESLQLSPKNEKAISLLDNIRYAVPEAVKEENGQYILLLLTATPTIAPSQTSTIEPSATPKPTDTQAPTLRPTYTLQPAEPTSTEKPPVVTQALTESTTPTKPAATTKPVLPVCGVVVLVPLIYLRRLRKLKQEDGSLVDKKTTS